MAPNHMRVVSEWPCVLGEGAFWDATSKRLLWVDIKDPAVCTFTPSTSRYSRHAMDEAIGFVVPNGDGFYAGFRSGLYRLDNSFGNRVLLAAPEPEKPGNRINDGTIDISARVWFGTMDDAERVSSGDYWCWDGNSLARYSVGWVVTNGPAFSSDGKRMYFANSVARQIFFADLDETGWPGPLQHFATIGHEEGYPDGMVTDAENHLWVAHWDGARVTRFAPDGHVKRVLRVPTSRPTKCAFGGLDGRTLYVTSAAVGLGSRRDPLAGHVFATDL